MPILLLLFGIHAGKCVQWQKRENFAINWMANLCMDDVRRNWNDFDCDFGSQLWLRKLTFNLRPRNWVINFWGRKVWGWKMIKFLMIRNFYFKWVVILILNYEKYIKVFSKIPEVNFYFFYISPWTNKR